MSQKWSFHTGALSCGRPRLVQSNWRSTKGTLAVLFVVLAGTLGLIQLAQLHRGWIPTSVIVNEPHDIAANISAGQHKLVIILPVNEPSVDLCKLLTSAVALGYPAPVLVNWNKDFHTDADGIGPSQLGKITGTLEYLQWATGTEAVGPQRLEEDDLVLMLDAHDIWMQLPPDILLSRYYSSNARANRRLAKELDLKNHDTVRQTIIAAAQKGCVAPRDRISDLHCNDVPESTLPRNVFGFFTDSRIMKWSYTRPRYVNSGSFMGPAGDMIKYLERVHERMDQGILKMKSKDDLGGDQGIFAEVFGEQEVARGNSRIRHATSLEVRSNTNLEHREFHVGLDYEQELFYPTCYSEHSGSFVHVDNVEELDEHSIEAGVKPPRIRELPRDLATADDPLAYIDGVHVGRRSWGELPLYADLWTTSIPATIHHNAWRDGLKNRRTTWWNRMWYFPYLRTLLEVQMVRNATRPLLHVDTSSGSMDVWPYKISETTVLPLIFDTGAYGKASSLRETTWDAVCQARDGSAQAQSNWYDEVFRDGRGSWPFGVAGDLTG